LTQILLLGRRVYAASSGDAPAPEWQIIPGEARRATGKPEIAISVATVLLPLRIQVTAVTKCIRLACIKTSMLNPNPECFWNHARFHYCFTLSLRSSVGGRGEHACRWLEKICPATIHRVQGSSPPSFPAKTCIMQAYIQSPEFVS